ncbi:6243_t:CDS:2 [Diversispora eburnea]|uniref:6243_t:CDS:1 n=1 Tax=Diversispora eburnea TaxID=1213867 RepID=A0A9N8ZKQ1_9GLOM|nr:6243_t:CDS:2 [Diversispora eburnea]
MNHDAITMEELVKIVGIRQAELNKDLLLSSKSPELYDKYINVAHLEFEGRAKMGLTRQLKDPTTDELKWFNVGYLCGKQNSIEIKNSSSRVKTRHFNAIFDGTFKAMHIHKANNSKVNGYILSLQEQDGEVGETRGRGDWEMNTETDAEKRIE